MTKIGNIRKWVKDKAGVSPIIAIILMVAITVVLAATIYVWVSGFGGSGSKTPAISCSVDNTNNKIVVTSADPGIAWHDISIKTDTTGATINGTLVGTSWKKVDNTIIPGGSTAEVSAGDELVVGGVSGNVAVTLRYDPTNTIIGTWTVNV